jgi:hypothetical protein
MTVTDDPDEFESRWKGEVDQFNLLWNSLPAGKLEDLQDAQDDLRELIEEAADSFREDE